MANCSGVFGTMVLEGEWSCPMIEYLNIIKGEWGIWHYCISVGDFETANQEVRFTANGCWSFDTNLERIGVWTVGTGKEEVKSAYSSLCAEMMVSTDEIGVSDTRIAVRFTEEEGGCRILREAYAEIVCTADRGLLGITVSIENYAYTKENIVKLGICDSLEGVDWV